MKKQKQESYFLQLPVEIQYNILSQLKGRDLTRVKQVNRCLRETVHSFFENFIWQQKVQTEFYRSLYDPIRAIFQTVMEIKQENSVDEKTLPWQEIYVCCQKWRNKQKSDDIDQRREAIPSISNLVVYSDLSLDEKRSVFYIYDQYYQTGASQSFIHYLDDQNFDKTSFDRIIKQLMDKHNRLIALKLPSKIILQQPRGFEQFIEALGHENCQLKTLDLSVEEGCIFDASELYRLPKFILKIINICEEKKIASFNLSGHLMNDMLIDILQFYFLKKRDENELILKYCFYVSDQIKKFSEKIKSSSYFLTALDLSHNSIDLLSFQQIIEAVQCSGRPWTVLSFCDTGMTDQSIKYCIPLLKDWNGTRLDFSSNGLITPDAKIKLLKAFKDCSSSLVQIDVDEKYQPSQAIAQAIRRAASVEVFQFQLEEENDPGMLTL